jgi:organic radical activating enzyme
MPVVPPTAALAGVPAGVQANGLWIGRRQLFVRFAAEAETATMYTPDALGGELGRLAARSVYHSVSVSGRDPLSNAAFLRAALERYTPPIPVMLDCDGQRPEAIGEVARFLKLIQVTLDGAAADSLVEQAMATLKAASAASVPHALVLAPEENTTDGQILRVLTQAHMASPAVSVVVHPMPETTEQDRRWLTFMEQAVALHGDIRLIPRLSRPTGMR